MNSDIRIHVTLWRIFSNLKMIKDGIMDFTKKGGLKLSYNPRDKQLVVAIHSNSLPLTINNKSELKRILKQLVI